MAMAFCLKFSLFLLLLWSTHVSLEAKDVCSDSYGGTFYGSEYSYLYLKLEEALITQHSRMLKTLRAGFISKNDLVVFIFLNVAVTNGTEGSYYCGDFNRNPAFCPTSNMIQSSWMLCVGQVYLNYRTPAIKVEQQFIAWMSDLHGSLISVLRPFYYFGYSDTSYDMDITLRIDRLDCNPSLQMMKCVLSELFSWVSAI